MEEEETALKQRAILKRFKGPFPNRPALVLAVQTFALEGKVKLVQDVKAGGSKKVVFIHPTTNKPVGKNTALVSEEEVESPADTADGGEEEVDTAKGGEEEGVGQVHAPPSENPADAAGTSKLDACIGFFDAEEEEEEAARGQNTRVEDCAHNIVQRRVLHVAVLEGGKWVDLELFGSDSQVVNEMQRTLKEVEDILRVNDQPLFGSEKHKCVERLLTLQQSGVSPMRCPKCAGNLYWDVKEGEWYCGGSHSVQLGRRGCDTSTAPL
jgi:hypothetical protein